MSETSDINPHSFDIRARVKFAKPVYQIKVFNVRYSASEDEVREHFSKFGKVVSVVIPISKSGQPIGSAIVSFSTQAEQREAIAQCDQTEFLGRKIYVEEKKPFDLNSPLIDPRRIDQPPRYRNPDE